jgi:hypothetical protein
MEDIYSHIISDEILSQVFKHIVLVNKSNGAPYHHLHHCMTVTKYLNEGVDYYIDYMGKDRRSILTAGMFHDINHSMGKENDEFNVKKAISSFSAFYEDNIDTLETHIDKDLVCDMIKATQYPYVIDDDDLTLYQKLIRDCDLMIVRDSDWFQNIIIGLGTEIGITDVSKAIDINIGFHKNVQMSTKWAKEIHKDFWPPFIKHLQEISELLNS